jgi:predicted ATPase/DNA-binding SARP family transcriptional activator/Tfp pilus assembly protein PilF
VTLNLFGPPRAAVDGAPVAGFRTDKVRALLAYLAVESDRPHSRAALAALFWQDMPDETALRNLRKTLHRLHEALGPPSGGAALDLPFLASRQTIQLNAAVWDVDVATFRRLLDDVARHPHRSLPLCTPCLERLTRATRLYGGELLAGFGLSGAEQFEEWLFVRREMLLHQVLQALYELTDAHLEREEYEAAYACAARQVELDPGREEAQRQALRALAMAGQRTEALASFERYKQTLLELLGVEPAAETVVLAELIREGALAGGVLPADQAVQAAPSRPASLPTHLTPFFGRETELMQIEEYLRDPACRLVTILGPGGVGKTRLAARAGERAAQRGRFPDGTVFFPLADVSAAGQLPAALVTGLGLELDEQQDPRTQLLDYLRPRECLLVLDNVEQLLDGVDLLVEILHAAPRVRLIVTSRLPLDLWAEQRLVLEGLDYPEQGEEGFLASSPTHVSSDIGAISRESSVQLFTHAVRRRRPDFELSASNAREVLRICSLVQGMPLALELAAPWVPMMDCAAIAEAIEQDLALLTTSARDVPDRHRSMEAVLAGSWRLLSQREQAMLAQLSVLRGSFDLAAAAAVAGVTLLDLASLVDRCLVARVGDGQYQLHELLRQFADRMQGSLPDADPDGVWERYSRHYLGLVSAHTSALYGGEPRRVVGALARQIPNVRRAWEWAAGRTQVTQLMESLEAIGRFWELGALFDDALAMLALAVDQMDAAIDAAPCGRRLLVRLLVCQAHVLEIRRRVDDGIRTAERALTLAERWEDGEGAAEARSVLGEILPHRGEFATATTELERACDYFGAAGSTRHLALALRRLGVVRWRAGAYAEAGEYLDRSRALQESLGDYWELGRVYSALAGVAFEQGDAQRALGRAHEALRLYEASDDRRNVAAVRGNLALVYMRLGQFDMALQHNGYDLEACRDLGDRHGTAVALANRAWIYRDSGDLEGALRCAREALQMTEQVGDSWEAARQGAEIAHIYQLQGKPALALDQYERALPVLRAHGGRYYVVAPLLHTAEVDLELGHHGEAASLVEEAMALAQELGLEDDVRRGRALASRIAAVAPT